MPDFVTTLHYPLRPEWGARAEVLTADGPSTATLVRRVVAASRRTPLMILDGFGAADRLAAGAIARRRRPPTVVITDCTWKLGDSLVDRMATRAAVRALDGDHAVFCVSSTDELERFPATWGIARSKLRLLHWYHGLTDDELAREPSEDGPIFSGGRSMRDYRALLAIAPELPVPVRIAADAGALGGEAPAGVEVGEVPHERYIEELLAARMLVLPLEDRAERSAGQTTYLNAMALGKLVVVTDTTGVRDHVEDRETGLIVPPGDPAALRSTIEWALDPANAAEVAAIRARAREVARTRFAPEHYVTDLLAMADELLARPVPA